MEVLEGLGVELAHLSGFAWLIRNFCACLPEKESCEASSDNGGNKLDVGGLGEAKGVHEVTLGQEVELITPGGLKGEVI